MTQLDVDQIRAATSDLLIGSELHYAPVVDSTNRVARDLLARDWRSGAVVMTDYQESGRGRQGRSWIAPPESSLLLSVSLAMPERAQVADSVMLGALAVADSVSEVTGLPVELKWPNDVLTRGRKFCGILAESFSHGRDCWVILGLGINVNFDPSRHRSLPPSATTLQWEAGESVSRERLAIALFNRLELWYRGFIRDVETVFLAWSSRLATLGNPLLVSDSAGTWAGVATAVRRDGGLIVRDDGGAVRTVHAADVSIRKPGGLYKNLDAS